ncbi:hypothetical protein P7K49_017168 [Saguinus oedipus]|uniref:Uncharacterized protein n=1 Tax=Saguinus oedipus TaxID=9490 RepID=A0ABQ9V4F6_SAGOE|nr:hypothetical protein P7K49_017168 [Saguinus oedipus]
MVTASLATLQAREPCLPAELLGFCNLVKRARKGGLPWSLGLEGSQDRTTAQDAASRPHPHRVRETKKAVPVQPSASLSRPRKA